jgi:Kef-type K+ transport system membrane component KefB
MDIIFLNLHDWSLPIKNPVFLMCILLLTVLTVPPLLNRFKLPGIVGLILMGAILGPHGINLLEQGDGIKLLSKIGLLYIMFWAGLEIDMASFLKNRHKSGTFGMLTFGFPLLLGGLCTYYLLKLDWMGALLLAGMFSTHTLISYPIVNRLRITKNEAVGVAVGGTIITDTLALLLLAVISGMAQGTMDAWFWVKLVLSLAVFGGLVFGLLPKVARWFFRRVESDITYQFVFVLAMLFVCGLLAELAGIEAIIGAFMAGLVLNRLIPHSSALMNRIEFVGNALFIPAFLFSVGMLINLRVFFKNEETIVTALVLTSVALLTKWLAAIATQKIYGYSKDQGLLIFGLSSSHAAATIAIILIGYEIKLFNESVLNATIFLILVTCLVSSFVTDRVARRMAAASIHAFSGTEKTQRILVPISNPASVVNLVDFAFLIKTPGKKEPVYPLSIILEEKDVRSKIKESQQLIAPVVHHAAEREIALSPIHRVDVSAVSGIQRAADELLATEIVIGWHPRVSATERLFGTLLDNLLDESPEMLFVTNMV